MAVLGLASTREKATILGNKLLSAGIIQHTTHRYDFQDRSERLYAFSQDCRRSSRRKARDRGPRSSSSSSQPTTPKVNATALGRTPLSPSASSSPTPSRRFTPKEGIQTWRKNLTLGSPGTPTNSTMSISTSPGLRRRFSLSRSSSTSSTCLKFQQQHSWVILVRSSRWLL
eukprot:m.129410 g.129410  ORF g.129410 m.129410 type:complete len:171 (-) comp15849_c1_seq6:24-536(-)